MTISLCLGGWISTATRATATLVVAGLLSVGCGSSTTSSGGTTTPVKAANADPSGKKAASAEASVEEEALVKVKENMFPPVDVGAWVCEPKTWSDGMALMHCIAPAGTKGLIASLKEMPEVVSAEPAK